MTGIVGLDLSPDGTALTYFENNRLLDLLLFSKVQKFEKKFPNYFCTVPKVKRGDERGRVIRLHLVANNIKSFIWNKGSSGNIDYICLEDYAYGKVSGSAYQIAELGGVIRRELFLNHPIRTHDPRSLKLFIEGNGNASKWDMVNSVFPLEKFEYDKKIKKVVNYLYNDYMDKYKKKKPPKPTGHPLEGLVDSIGLGRLMYQEVLFREGKIQLKEMKENEVRVFQRTTKNIPECLIDRKFLFEGDSNE